MMNHLHPDQLAAMALTPDVADPDDRAHLDECARCTSELAVLRDVSTRARGARPEGAPPAPPEAVWDRVVQELTAAGEVSSERTLRRPPVWRQPWAAAAALVAVVVLVAAVFVSFSSSSGAVVAEATLEPLADVEPATAVLIAEGERRELTVDTPVLPAIDGYYELWLLTPDGSRLISLGPVDDSTPHEIPATVDTDQYSVVDISREPPDGDPNHSTDSVLRGPLQPST